MTEARQGDLLEELGELTDEEVQGVLRRINEATGVERDLQLAFEKFHVANPGVYRALVALAREAKAAGHDHLGIGMIWEVLRWQTLVGDTRATDGYRLNNNHRAFYARAIMTQEPDLAGFFETRRSTADE